jgi:ribosomal protein L37E
VVAWPPDWQQKLIDALVKAGADRPCPRCGHDDFNLLDGYVSFPLQARLAEGPAGSISTVATICERCGYLSQHVLNVLLAEDIPAEGTTPDGA